MRDLASCFSEYSIQVSSDASCSSYSSHSCISPTLTPSTQDTVTSLYKSILSSSDKEVFVTVTWCKNNLSQALTITLGDDSSNSFRLNTVSRPFRKKKKGSKSIEFDNSARFEVFWDLSVARYGNGPEPIDGFYVLVLIGSELGLILGDMAEEAVTRKLKAGTPMANFALISRREHFSGNTLYSTRAQFSNSGASHEILIRCNGESEGMKYPVLSVCIDKKTVIRVKRLQWNFRGNQTIFVDGLLVDLMWDVHGWFHSADHHHQHQQSGCGVFMFRTRSGMDSRLWLEEKMVQKDDQQQDNKVEFSFLIYASKSSS